MKKTERSKPSAGRTSRASYRRHPMSLVQRIAVTASAVITFAILVALLAYILIMGVPNLLCCIKMAKYYELTEDDVVVTVLTDSAVMYKSRVEELNAQHGAYSAFEAEKDHALHMLGLKTDSMLELTYTERKRVHNLKYYTWVEQQGMNVEDLNAQWYDTKGTWDAVHAQAKDLDELIDAFNDEVGILKTL